MVVVVIVVLLKALRLQPLLIRHEEKQHLGDSCGTIILLGILFLLESVVVATEAENALAVVVVVVAGRKTIIAVVIIIIMRTTVFLIVVVADLLARMVSPLRHFVPLLNVAAGVLWYFAWYIYQSRCAVTGCPAFPLFFLPFFERVVWYGKYWLIGWSVGDNYDDRRMIGGQKQSKGET